MITGLQGQAMMQEGGIESKSEATHEKV